MKVIPNNLCWLWIGGVLWAFQASAQQASAQEDAVANHVTLGLGYLDQDAYYFGHYTGIAEEGTVGWLDLHLASEPEWDSEKNGYWAIEGRDLGLDTAFLDLQAGTRGKQHLQLSYRELPHYYFGDGQTPFRLTGTNRWSLPAGWQAVDATTQGMTSLNDYLVPEDIRHERRQLDLRYERQLAEPWTLHASYQRQTKEGWRTLGAMIGSNGGNARAAILPAAMDFETDSVNLGITYGLPHASIGLHYHGSVFQNQADGLRWQNPFGQHMQWAPGVGYPDGVGRLSTEPDNSFHQLQVRGNYRFGRTTSGSMSLAVGRMEQSDDFLPYTVNPDLAVSAPLTRQSLDGEINTLNAALRLSMRPVSKIHLVARYDFDERDNQTPRLLLRPVSGDASDQVSASDARRTRPYSYRKQSAAVDASYRLLPRTRFKLGYQLEVIDRDYSEVNHSREYTTTLGVIVRPLDDVNLNLDYDYSERRGEVYQGNRPLVATHVPGTIAEEDFENHPLLRKYYLADRQRDRLRAKADWYINPRLSAGISWAYNLDDYGDSNFGLNESSLTSYALDLSYQPAKHLQVTGFYTVDYYQQDQSGRAFTPAPGQADDPARNWWTTTDDRFQTANLQLEYQEVQQHLDRLRDWGLEGVLNLGASISDSRSRGEVVTRVAADLTRAPLPDLQTRLREWQLYGRYTWPSGDSLRLSVSGEKYRTDDFGLDQVGPDTMANVLSLGQTSPDYDVNWITLSYRKQL